MTPERAAVAAELPLDAWCRAILDDSPKTSSAELLRRAKAEGRGAGLTKAHFKRIREAWENDGGPPAGGLSEELEDAPSLEACEARFAEAARTGDYRAAQSWARTIAIHKGQEPEGQEEEDPLDWSRLDEVQRSCMFALTALAAGQDLTDDALWFVVLLSRVPSARAQVHPAHVPLPEVERPATLVVEAKKP